MRHRAARFSFVRARAGSDHIRCDKPGTPFAAPVANSCRAHCFAKIEPAIYSDDAKYQRHEASVDCEFSTISGGEAGAG